MTTSEKGYVTSEDGGSSGNELYKVFLNSR